MAGPTVYTDVADDFDFASGGQLFAGKKFWVAQRVPTRNRLLDNIRANGGEIVLLEKKADYRIADHCRRDCALGTISYEFVEKSIKDGALRDPEDHRAGPREDEVREPGGSTHQPARSGRAAYTAEEDRILYKWVHDCGAGGGLAGGNEIYKQLEAKYPRHTWQSWRDRYLKQLKNRPPSAFNIPDNAPPSPPSDQSNERLAPGTSASAPAKQPTPQPAQLPAAMKVSGKGKTKVKDEYSVKELEALFSQDDWLELYAFVDDISSVTDDEKYKSAWLGFAEMKGSQTADQWRQYYEKVVRPQWLRDPEWKKVAIKKRMEQEIEGGSPSQTTESDERQHAELEKETEAPAAPTLEGDTVVDEPTAPEDEHIEKPLRNEVSARVPPAYTMYARERKWDTLNAQPGLDYTALHRFLLTEWDSLTEEQKAPYMAMDAAITKQTLENAKDLAKFSSDLKTLSSSTARPESPKFLENLKEKFLKRLRDVSNIEEEEDTELSRPIKRQKSGSATPTRIDAERQLKLVGTLDQSLEISSAESSSVTSQLEGAHEPTQDEAGPELAEYPFENLDGDETIVEHGEAEAEELQSMLYSDDSFTDIDDDERLPSPPGHEAAYDSAFDASSDEDYIGAVSVDELPADSPTPRANRQKISDFDTQAILSSPTQNTSDRILRPQGYVSDTGNQQKQRSLSPAQQYPSDASTTQSLEEFRRSLDDDNLVQLRNSQFPPEQHRTSPSPSPAPSSSSVSTNSGDPDPPLQADDLNEFFDEQHDQGFPDAHIVKALHRTRLRPELAVKVLDAWREGLPLPDERGIWSVEDDAAVESGDGFDLAKLEMKHTMDGWGGITERMLFLEANRNV